MRLQIIVGTLVVAQVQTILMDFCLALWAYGAYNLQRLVQNAWD